MTWMAGWFEDWTRHVGQDLSFGESVLGGFSDVWNHGSILRCKPQHVYLWLTLYIHIIWVFPKIGVPQNGWFIMKNPIKMGWFGGTPIFRNTHICSFHIKLIFCLTHFSKTTTCFCWWLLFACEWNPPNWRDWNLFWPQRSLVTQPKPDADVFAWFRSPERW